MEVAQGMIAIEELQGEYAVAVALRTDVDLFRTYPSRCYSRKIYLNNYISLRFKTNMKSKYSL